MKNLIMICSLVLIGQVANAGAFIEPYIGMEKGELDFGSTGTADTKGTALGLRAGYQMVIPWVALDVKLVKGDAERVPEADTSYTDVGVTVGASVPFLRPFIGYIPAAKMKLEGSGITDEYSKGTGLKLGLGIKILPLVDINIEQVSYEFKERDGVELSEKTKHKSLMIGLGMTF